MPHKMKGYAELKDFADKKRAEDNDKYVKAAVAEKKRILKMTPAEVGKMQATMYARAMYLSGLSGERVL